MHPGTVAAVAVFIAGAAVAFGAVASSVTTVILPRGAHIRLVRVVMISLRLLFKLRIRSSTSYEVRDRILAFYAPVSIFAVLACWVIGLGVAFMGMLWAVGVHPVRSAFEMSGASITTLGFLAPKTVPQVVLVFAEAAFGLVELAMVITFLPSVYNDFHRRERDVTHLRTEAGNPPEGVNILIRLWRLGRLDARTEVWKRMNDWFIDVEDSHTSFPMLAFFRSSNPDHSWVTAAGAVLDGAALAASCLNAPRDFEAELCIRTGYLCLRRVAELFRLPFDDDPAPTERIVVARSEFDEAWDRMAAAGVPLKADRDQAWLDFAGWRVNYDEPLVRLATLTEAPLAPWSSDRGLVDGRRVTFIERIRL